MKKIDIFFIILLFFVAISSCKTNVKEKNSKILDYKKDTLKKVVYIKQENTKIKVVNIKNMAIKNKLTFGNLIYDLKIDTIQDNMIDKRFVFFTASTDKNAMGIDMIESTAQDALLDTTGVDSVNFQFKVKFSESRMNILKLGIRDIIYIVPKDTVSDFLRLELNYIYEHPVIVKDSV